MEGLIFVFLWVLFSVLAGQFASRRGFGFIATFILSLILSPLLGFISVAVRQPRTQAVEAAAIQSGEMRKCPSCAELVRAEARKCKHCGDELPPL